MDSTRPGDRRLSDDRTAAGGGMPDDRASSEPGRDGPTDELPPVGDVEPDGSPVGEADGGPVGEAHGGPVGEADGSPGGEADGGLVGEPGVDQPVVEEPPRSERSPRDMAISLLVLLVPLLLVFGAYQIFLDGAEAPAVDPGPALAQARAAAVFPVSEAVGLPDGWRTVRANFQRDDAGATLRVGYVTPEGGGVQLVQSSVPPERLLPAELTADGTAQGPTEVGGRSWQRYTGRPGELALVLLQPGRTVLVVGAVPEGDLRRLAGSLR